MRVGRYIKASAAGVAGLARCLLGTAGAVVRPGRLVRGIGLAVLVGLVGAGQATATHLDAQDAFYWQLPAAPVHPGNSGGAIATSADGNFVYVADPYGNAIDEYTSDGTLVRSIRFGRRPMAPTSVTTDLSGDVYVVYQATGTVARYTANLRLLSTWSVFGAQSIAADRAGHLWVLTNFLDAVGEYDPAGKSIGGFVANLPGQYFPAGPAFDPRYYPPTGYDPPYKTVAKAIAVDRVGDPIVVGDSYQALSDPQPDCHVVIDDDHIDIQPYPDPLISGEIVRFRPGGTPVTHGWLSTSQMSCWDIASEGNDPSGVAVDPNTGDLYSTSDVWLGVFHSRGDLSNTRMNLNAPSYACSSMDCPAADWDLIAGNPAQGVAVDCRSNLYMLTDNGNARFVTKFNNSDSVPPGACSPLLQRASLLPPITVFSILQRKQGGKASVVLGCDLKLCVGTLKLTVASRLCRGCVIGGPWQFRISAGSRETLSVPLTKRGRQLLAGHPGLGVSVAAKLISGQGSVASERVREPVGLTARCTFPGSIDGSAEVSGALSPSHGHELIRVEYVPASGSGALLPAVQRTAFTNSAGRYADHYALRSAGKWIVLVSWGGDTTREPAGAAPCAATVAKARTQATLVCPRSPSIGTPGQFSGSLSGAPADAGLAVLYEDPAGAIVIHDLTVGSGGKFTDSFAPNRAGRWYAIAHYDGDSNHAPAVAQCQLAVPRTTSTVSLQCSPDPNRRFISCTGQLASVGATIGGARIALTYQPPAPGSATVDTVTTLASGRFTDTMNAPPGSLLASGGWSVTARYSGDAAHAAASDTQSVTVS
jgi:hypothetical protein